MRDKPCIPFTPADISASVRHFTAATDTEQPVSGRRGGIRPGAPIQTKLPPIIAERGACRTRGILNTPIICRALSGKRQTLTLPGPYKKAAKPEPVLRLFDLVCLFGISFNQTDKLIDI